MTYSQAHQQYLAAASLHEARQVDAQRARPGTSWALLTASRCVESAMTLHDAREALTGVLRTLGIGGDE